MTFPSVSDALNLLAERREVEPDWQRILELASVEQRQAGSRLRWRRSPGWRATLVLAAALVALLAATAFATGLADRFSAWISGKPGSPAPAALQHGFRSRNRASLAAFPAGTTLRLLMRQRVSGTSFDLLGFRNGDAYCLRLIRTDRPGGRGSNQCLRADELQGHAALVADDVWFGVGHPEISITGVYGFASDDVKSVRVRRAHGDSITSVQNNVFLSLRGQPSGTVQHHPPPNPVVAVAAVLRNGELRNIPYAIPGGGILPGGVRPTVPTYFAPAQAERIPGAPHQVTAPISHPTVGWVSRREKRGAPLPPDPKRDPFVKLEFGRLIQPDPDDPLRLGVGVGRPQGMTRGHPIRGNWLCLIEFDPLTTTGGSEGCGPLLTASRPIALGPWLESPITHFNGLAADGIARIEAFLATGQRVPAALRDNVFSVGVPQADLPGEIVGYTASGQVAAIVPLQANAVAKPCPPAEFTTPTAQLPPPQKWEQLDLATLTVAGQKILGKTPDEVRAILGEPTLIRPHAQTTNGLGIPEFRYGGTMPATLGLSITFLKRGNTIVANSLYFQSPSLVDARLGHILRIQPSDLQQQLSRAYATQYRLDLPYGTAQQLQCSGTFRARAGAVGINFGLNPHRPSRPYLEIRANGG